MLIDLCDMIMAICRGKPGTDVVVPYSTNQQV